MSEEQKSVEAPSPEPLKKGDLSDEVYREYRYPDGTIIRIHSPKWLYTRPGGTTHRVVDVEGLVHCVHFTPGVHLVWKPRIANSPVAF